MIAYISIPLIVCIIGAIIWGLASEKYPKLVKAGEIMFAAGLLAWLLVTKW